jgi:hypothetical protein
LAGGAAAEKFQFVLEIRVAACFRNLLFEMLDGAGDIENLNRPAVAANEIILMTALPEAVVSGPTVKSNASNDTFLLQPRDESIDRRRVAGNSEEGARPDLLERKRLPCLEKNFEAGSQGTGSPQAGIGTLVE